MPLSPQIVITPEDIVYKSSNITAVTYTSSTATYTSTGHTLSAGDVVMITGLSPDGYNGTYTISSVTINTFTVANTTNAVLTDQVGNVYWADPTEYEYDGGQTVNYIADAQDIDSVTLLANGKNKAYRQTTPPPSGSSAGATINEGDIWFDTDDKNKQYYYTSGSWVSVQDGTIADAQADALEALADAAAAQAAASQAAVDAAQAEADAAFALTAAGNAQATADGKNKIYRQATAPTGTLVAGDLWFDTSTGNKPYRYSGTAWVSVQDDSIATALSTANAAQTTANGKNKVTYSASTPGTTANTAGDIWWQFSGGNIIAQWTGAGGTSWTSNTLASTVIASIDAGKITAGTISVAISLSAATITGGSINIGSGVFVVSAAGAVTMNAGSINLNSGTFAVSAAGAVTITSGSFSINSGTFAVSSAGAVTINSGSLNIASGTFAVTAAGAITATSGTIGGSTLASGTITGGTIQTSSGSAAVILNGASNALQFKTGGSVVGNIVPLSSFGVLMHYGATADPSGGTFPQMFVGSANVSMFANASNGIGISTSGVSVNGNTSLNNQTVYPGVATGAGTQMVVVTTGSRMAIVTSSERFKEQINYIATDGWLDKVLAMRPITYRTREDYVIEGEENNTQVGFLAEDIYDLGGGLENTVILDPLGDPFSLSYERLTVFLTLAIKELKAEIDKLKGE